MLNSSVLILNRSFLPIHVTSVRRAFAMIYQGAANVVDEDYQTFDFEGWHRKEIPRGTDVIGTSRGAIRVPRVIVLRLFDRLPKRHVRYSRSNVFSRDNYTCQYCGTCPARAQLNLDHVVPRSQGGRTTWENVVASCVTCNRRKGGRTPEQAKLRLRRPPTRPRWIPFASALPAGPRFREWQPFVVGGAGSTTESSTTERARAGTAVPLEAAMDA
jgi:5-methylcytosine-specific restriction endonuclease McrA